MTELRSSIPTGIINDWTFLRNVIIRKTLTAAEKNSTNLCVIAIGTYTGPCDPICNRNIVLKISFQYDNAPDDLNNISAKLKTLQYESCVYEHVAKILSQDNRTNMIPFVASIFTEIDYAHLKSWQEIFSLGNSASQNAMELYGAINNLYEETRTTTNESKLPKYLHINITEHVETLSLPHFLNNLIPGLTEDIIKTCIFQVLLGIHRLASIGVQKNDMSIDNILVEPERTDKIVHMVNEIPYQVNWEHGRILLGDYENSYTPNCGNNEYLTKFTCANEGACSNFNNKYDAYTFLSTLYDFLVTYGILNSYPNFMAFYQEVIRITPIVSATGKMLSSNYGQDEPVEISNIGYMLSSQYFYDLRVAPPAAAGPLVDARRGPKDAAARRGSKDAAGPAADARRRPKDAAGPAAELSQVQKFEGMVKVKLKIEDIKARKFGKTCVPYYNDVTHDVEAWVNMDPIEGQHDFLLNKQIILNSHIDGPNIDDGVYNYLLFRYRDSDRYVLVLAYTLPYEYGSKHLDIMFRMVNRMNHGMVPMIDLSRVEFICSGELNYIRTKEILDVNELSSFYFARTLDNFRRVALENTIEYQTLFLQVLSNAFKKFKLFNGKQLRFNIDIMNDITAFNQTGILNPTTHQLELSIGTRNKLCEFETIFNKSYKYLTDADCNTNADKKLKLCPKARL